ncbi:hypothetical protein FGLOB1_1027 [Fusarium globosum]|uniref:Uncharacterized protein n=1 Tax=Fusarium globosum TaxID=78864 RepID=A0A8H5YWB3_9HYPO|nr:hypothetical protein FGLOB1_1027 [Fusarium globosum]
MENSQPQPPVEPVRPVDPPTGWPLCERDDAEGIRAYNTYVNEWTTWASADPLEDKDKWGEALKLVNICGGKNPFSCAITQAAEKELEGERYEKKWYPRSRIRGIRPYNEEGPSFNSRIFEGLTPVRPQTN